MDRRIVHVDMDAFFASVEADRRGLEGEPVVVCVYSGRSEDSGVVSTCSYEARKLGIRAGIPITRAKTIASDADEDIHFVPMDREFYSHIADRITEAVLEEHTDRIEHASIDEAYLDVTEETASFDGAVELADAIRDGVRDRFDLTCSVGVGPNKLVAKIASDQDKPDGLTTVRPEEVEAFMRSLDLEEIHGIGPETDERLRELGIKSVGELAEADRQRLAEVFGDRQGPKLVRIAQGQDDDPVEEREQQQISRLRTLETDTDIEGFILDAMEPLAADIMAELEDAGLWFRTVVVLAIDTEIEMHTRSETFETPVQDRDVLMEAAAELLGRFLTGTDVEIRRVGLRVKNLEQGEGQQSLTDF